MSLLFIAFMEVVTASLAVILGVSFAIIIVLVIFISELYAVVIVMCSGKVQMNFL
jgi:hypothetical protein